MTFYALDSLVNTLIYMRKQRELEGEDKLGNKPQETKKKPKRKGHIDPKEHMARGVRNCFMQILRRVKSQLFDNEDRIDKEVIWAKVDSCRVHVLSWLLMWDRTEQGDDNYIMSYYSMEELHEMKVRFLWWLVTNPNNIHRETFLSLVEEYHQRKRNK